MLIAILAQEAGGLDDMLSSLGRSLAVFILAISSGVAPVMNALYDG